MTDFRLAQKVPTRTIPFFNTLKVGELATGYSSLDLFSGTHKSMFLAAFATLFLLALFLFFLSLLPSLFLGSIWTHSTEWVPQMGFTLSFKADGLAVLFALLISGMGFLISIYASSYLKGHKYLSRFYVAFLLFTLSMLGVVLSDNIFGLFVFWELTSISSYLLIGFDHEKEDARKSALQAFLITGTGGLCLLAGFSMLAHVGGQTSMSSLVSVSSVIQQSKLYVPIVVCVLLGAFTKSAQVPFHFWLPNAMAAPTPVSAYLHSATMVKAGIFLIARLSPVLGASVFWKSTLVLVGAMTLLLASWLSLGQRDLKKILAYSTLAALGTLTLLLGIGSPLAFKAFFAFLLAHAIYKASLFMIVGAIDHEVGTRDVTQLARLWKKMPRTAGLALLSGLAFAGLPPSWSFIAKETALEAAMEALPAWSGIVALVSLGLGALGFVYLTLLLVWSVFFAGPIQLPRLKELHEAPWALSVGSLVLGLLGLLSGLFPGQFFQALISSALLSLGKLSETPKFSLWHGFNPPLFVTLLAILCGLWVFSSWPRLQNDVLRQIKKWPLSPEQCYLKGVADLPHFAHQVFSFFQNGKLRFYVGVVLGFTFIFILSAMDQSVFFPVSQKFFAETGAVEFLVGLALGLGALLAWLARDTFVALASTGVIGIVSALCFVFYGAPDLAITQVLVESLSIILLVFCLRRFSEPDRIELSRLEKMSSQALALGMGALIGVMMLLTLHSKTFSSISTFFSEHSYRLAHGKNIVNVILVDFRGWDTMGEITVLAIASLGVCSLLGSFAESKKGEK